MKTLFYANRDFILYELLKNETPMTICELIGWGKNVALTPAKMRKLLDVLSQPPHQLITFENRRGDIFVSLTDKGREVIGGAK